MNVRRLSAEVLLVEPEARSVRWLGCGADDWEPIVRSAVVGLDVEVFVTALRWP